MHGEPVEKPFAGGDEQKADREEGQKQEERIAEELRSHHKLHGAVSDFRVDDNQLEVSFKGPGYAADIFIDRDTNKYDLTETRNGFIAVINDLHKGRDTGASWSMFILL